MRIEFKCPSCGNSFSVEEQVESRPVSCTICGAIIHVAVSLDQVSIDSDLQFWRAGRRDAVMSRVRAPAIALLLTGLLGCFVDVFQLIYATMLPPLAPQHGGPDWFIEMVRASQGPVPAAVGAFFAVMSITMFASAIAMLRGRGWTLGVIGSSLALVNFGNFCFLFGLPVGIWSLHVLRQPDVRWAFSGSCQSPRHPSFAR